MSFELVDSEIPVNEQEITNLEKEVGVSLPADYLNFIHKNNGGRVHRVSYYAPKEKEWNEVYGFLPIGSSFSESVSVYHAIDEFPNEYLPVVSVAEGNGYFFFLSCSKEHYGKIITFAISHGELYSTAESFTAFLDGINTDPEVVYSTGCKNEPWKSAERGEWEVIGKAIEDGFDLASIDNDAKRGYPILTVAVTNLRLDLVKRLLAAGADPNEQGTSGMTAVHVAAYAARSRQIMDLLLEAGGSLTIGDQYGHTPLHSMVQHGATLEVFKWLLTKGCDLKIKDNFGMTPVDMIKKKIEGNPSRWKPILDLVEITQ